jgi:hypothetical protein
LDRFDTRDPVVVALAAAAPHTLAAVGWVFCSGDRLRARFQGCHSDEATCRLLLSAVEAVLVGQEGMVPGLAAAAAACSQRSVALPDDAAFMYHDPPAAGDVIYN